MRVALACDTLLSHNYQTKVMESLVMLFPDCEVFTLVHQPGNVTGPIEHKKIHSSFLSHFVRNEEDFWKWMPMIPGAASNLFIPCSFDLIICVGSGIASMINHCKTTPKLTYLLSNYRWWPEKKRLTNKMFRGMVRSTVNKSLKSCRMIYSAGESFLEGLDQIPCEVLAPPVKIERFPLFGKAQRNLFKESYWLMDAESFEELELKEVLSFMNEKQLNYRMIKNQRDHGQGEFFLDDQLAPLAANSKGLIIGSQRQFSELAIKEMATGRPVVMSARGGMKNYLSPGEGAKVFSNTSELKEILDVFQAEDYTPEKVRGMAMDFNDVKFKIRWNKIAEKMANKVIEN